MNPYLIAIIDDDQHIRELVEAYLKKEQFRTVALASAEEGLVQLNVEPPDMWILDIMLPGMDGYEFCRHIRRDAEVPIMMISARDNEVDKILGLELGSDDYMVKPFSPREMVARVKRQLQRWYKRRTREEEKQVSSVVLLEAGQFQLALDERRVFWCGEEVDVTSKEFALLQTLAERPNRAFARDELLTLIWGDDYFGSDRAVDHLVKRLRKKIEELPVEAVWGHGYRLRMNGGEMRHEASLSD
ncbi:two-component system response regulator CssR [Paenibacillus endophyticus]|uniref:Two-component system response regulator CssR n=1 Tax=Paenibacillus endophyticus TaxID=1294268 RepID=A0A7W5C6L4_9BACL|nr:response regulator transcription factor [Paenibacillus endophyticus]MBB3151882.1 two-component system response regulator CssR [Paenibacillus endophyticus]